MVHKQLVYVMALRSTGKFSVTDNGGSEYEKCGERERGIQEVQIYKHTNTHTHTFQGPKGARQW